MKIIKLTMICAFLIFGQSIVRSQSLPVGTKALEDYYRRSQLLGTADTSVSFTIRPLYPASLKRNAFFPDSTERDLDTNSTRFSKNGKLRTVLLPFTALTSANSTHPYGWNDGAMIPSKDLQILVSGGVFFHRDF